jgi:hypothetical protein
VLLAKQKRESKSAFGLLSLFWAWACATRGLSGSLANGLAHVLPRKITPMLFVYNA